MRKASGESQSQHPHGINYATNKYEAAQCAYYPCECLLSCSHIRNKKCFSVQSRWENPRISLQLLGGYKLSKWVSKRPEKGTNKTRQKPKGPKMSITAVTQSTFPRSHSQKNSGKQMNFYIIPIKWQQTDS